jgi:hypothetical protein
MSVRKLCIENLLVWRFNKFAGVLSIPKLAKVGPRESTNFGIGTLASERQADHARQIGFPIGLGEQKHAGIETAMMDNGVLGIA